MKNPLTRHTLLGFAAGLSMALIASLLLWVNQGRSETLITLIDLAAGFPVLVARKLELRRPFFDVLFFAYSGLNGAGIARLLRRYSAPAR